MDPELVDVMDSVEGASQHWAAWGKTLEIKDLVAAEEVKAGRKAFLSSISHMVVKPSTSLAVVLNAGVETATYILGEGLGKQGLNNLKRRLKRQARSNGKELMKFLVALNATATDETEAVVINYAATGDTVVSNLQHLRRQLLAFSSASIEELRWSLERGKKDDASSLESNISFYPLVDHAGHKAEDEAFTLLKKKYKDNPKRSVTTVPAPKPSAIDVMYNLAKFSGQADSGMQLSRSDGDDSSTAEEDVHPGAGNNKRRVDQTASTSPVHSYKLARCDDNTGSVDNPYALHKAAESQRSEQEQNRLQEQWRELENWAKELKAKANKLDDEIRTFHKTVELEGQQLGQSQSDLQQLLDKLQNDQCALEKQQRAHQAAIEAHTVQVANDKQVMTEREDKHKERRTQHRADVKAHAERVAQDQRALEEQQREHQAAVEAHAERVAQDQRALEEQQREHQAAVEAHARQVSQDYYRLGAEEHKFRNIREHQEWNLKERCKRYTEWEERLQRKDRKLAQREQDLYYREEDNNQWVTELNNREAELRQREDDEVLSQTASAGGSEGAGTGVGGAGGGDAT